MRVDTYYPHELTATRMTENIPCDVGDEVILRKTKSCDAEYDAFFGEKTKLKTRCVSVYMYFINFSDGQKTICVNKADIHTGLIKIELAR